MTCARVASSGRTAAPYATTDFCKTSPIAGDFDQDEYAPVPVLVKSLPSLRQ